MSSQTQNALDFLAAAASSSPCATPTPQFNSCDSPATSPPGSPPPSSPELAGSAPAARDAAPVQQPVLQQPQQQQQPQAGPAQMMQMQMPMPTQYGQWHQGMVPMAMPSGCSLPSPPQQGVVNTMAGMCPISWQPMWVPSYGQHPQAQATHTKQQQHHQHHQQQRQHQTAHEHASWPALAHAAAAPVAAPLAAMASVPQRQQRRAATAKAAAVRSAPSRSAGVSRKGGSKRKTNPHPTAVEDEDSKSVHPRPLESYAQLAAAAIMELPDGKATVKQIYDHVEDTHPFYKYAGAPWWKNCIRHNLSMKPCFIRHPNAGGVGVHLWSLAAGVTSVDDIPCRRRGSRVTVLAKSNRGVDPKKVTARRKAKEAAAAATAPSPPPAPQGRSLGFDQLLEAAGNADGSGPMVVAAH